MDLSYLYPREQCACGSWLRKMAPFAGRGDNMVKLRGVNVWPEAVGDDRARGRRASTPDWFVRAVRDDNRDELIVSVVQRRATRRSSPTLASAVETRLKDRLGVAHHAPRSSRPARSTRGPRSDTSPKLKRFRDDR